MNYTTAVLATIALLTVANCFMTLAWYGHLKYTNYALPIAIAASWGIAFFEYCFQVPANRIGHQYLSVIELKAIQEVITVIVVILFSIFYMGESLKVNHYIGLSLLAAGTCAVFYK